MYTVYMIYRGSELHFGTKEDSVAYAENFHEGDHSMACGGNLYLVCAVCDVTI